ncbi:MAG TPA: hypothetical protein VN577_13505 [Terriglobales bacterium]|nr:hypothetical protein [Terriglobales bacterium]
MENVADFEQYLQNLPSDFPVDLSLMPKGAVLTESMESEVNLLEDQYLKRMKLAKVDRASTSDSEIGNSETENSQSEKNDSGRESTSVQGRAYIRRRMQESFVHFGLWDFLHKEISIESYTFKGDPLKIDFGYLNPAANTFRMLHAVSLTMNLNQTRNFGLSWEPIRDGFNKGKNQTAEMIAVVEAENLCQSEVARSARSWMERNGILVRPVTEMMNIAAEALAELRL